MHKCLLCTYCAQVTVGSRGRFHVVWLVKANGLVGNMSAIGEMPGVPSSGPRCDTDSILALGVLLEVSAKGCGVVGVAAGAAPPLLAGAGLGRPPPSRTHLCVVGHCHPELPGGRGTLKGAGTVAGTEAESVRFRATAK